MRRASSSTPAMPPSMPSVPTPSGKRAATTDRNASSRNTATTGGEGPLHLRPEGGIGGGERGVTQDEVEGDRLPGQLAGDQRRRAPGFAPLERGAGLERRALREHRRRRDDRQQREEGEPPS